MKTELEIPIVVNGRLEYRTLGGVAISEPVNSTNEPFYPTLIRACSLALFVTAFGAAVVQWIAGNDHLAVCALGIAVAFGFIYCAVTAHPKQ